jgi:cytochrome c
MISMLKTIEWRSLLLAAATFGVIVTAEASADLTRKHNCVACHAEAQKKVGPAYRDIAKKYAGRADAADYLTKKIRSGGSGVWGAMPMPPHPQVPESDARTMATYVLDVK